jgi:hypothetical protein
MQIYCLEKSQRKDKKWRVRKEYPETGKIIHFGGRGYEDYPEHKDEKRKENYIKRHRDRENWDDLTTAGAWSKGILWNKPTLYDSIKDMEQYFDIKIVVLGKI